MSIVSDNIKYLRRVNGLTQEQFARRIGIKRSLLGAYEEARANPNLSNLMNIAKIFGTSVDNLIKNDIRKLRENQSVPLPQASSQLLATKEEPPVKEARDTKEVPLPKPIASVIEKYYRESNQIKLVAQRVTPKRVIPIVAQVNNSLQSASQTDLDLGAMRNGTAPPLFNKAYDTENRPASNGSISGATAVSQPVARPVQEKSLQTTELVRQQQAKEYAHHYTQSEFLRRLPVFPLPVLPPGNYRAFEVGEDFAFPGAIVIGELVRNLYELVDGKNYLVVTQHQGILYRRVYNQVKIRGVLLLSSDKANLPSFEITVKEVLEVWEAKAFVSTKMPEPPVLLDRLSSLVSDLQSELERLKQ